MPKRKEALERTGALAARLFLITKGTKKGRRFKINYVKKEKGATRPLASEGEKTGGGKNRKKKKARR